MPNPHQKCRAQIDHVAAVRRLPPRFTAAGVARKFSWPVNCVGAGEKMEVFRNGVTNPCI